MRRVYIGFKIRRIDWAFQSEVLFYGLYSEISGGRMPNKVTGTTDYLTVSGSAGSETYECPDTANYYNADLADMLWFKPNGDLRTVTTSMLVDYDHVHTPVWYDDDSPNQLRGIIILKSNLSGDILEWLYETFRLPIMRSGIWVDSGYEKSNRSMMEQSLFEPYQYEAESLSIFIRALAADGVEQTIARKEVINNCIVSLKAAGLFETKFDVLVVLRGTGAGCTKLNWINTYYTATAQGSPTYTNNVGYTGTSGNYIKTNYTPRTASNLLKRDDASFIMKLSGTIGLVEHGVIGEGNLTHGSAWTTNCNSGAYTIFDTTTRKVSGYNCNTRTNSTNLAYYRNASAYSGAQASVDVPSYSPYITSTNNWGTASGSTGSAEVVELYAFGKYLSQAEFLTFSTIMNTYFSSL